MLQAALFISQHVASEEKCMVHSLILELPLGKQGVKRGEGSNFHPHALFPAETAEEGSRLGRQC